MPSPALVARRLVGLLLLLAAFAAPGRAQEAVSLRAVHGGAFLPEGTEVLVLQTEGTRREYGRYQPVFIGRDAYPRDPGLVVARDSLDARRSTHRAYPRTQDAGALYFLYARTPDGTLYWSYSAERDSLKYDVVNLGVMSVAPIPDAAVRQVVEARLFAAPEAAPPEKRVVVHLPEDRARDTVRRVRPDTLALAAALPSDSAASPPIPPVAATDTATVAEERPEAGSRLSGAALPPAVAAEGVHLSYGLLYGVLAALLALAAVPAVMLFQTRRELVTRRNQLFALRGQLSNLQSRCDELTRTAHDADQRRLEAEHKHQLLKATYDAVREELTSLQALARPDGKD